MRLKKERSNKQQQVSSHLARALECHQVRLEALLGEAKQSIKAAADSSRSDTLALARALDGLLVFALGVPAAPPQGAAKTITTAAQRIEQTEPASLLESMAALLRVIARLSGDSLSGDCDDNTQVIPVSDIAVAADGCHGNEGVVRIEAAAEIQTEQQQQQQQHTQPETPQELPEEPVRASSRPRVAVKSPAPRPESERSRRPRASVSMPRQLVTQSPGPAPPSVPSPFHVPNPTPVPLNGGGGGGEGASGEGKASPRKRAPPARVRSSSASDCAAASLQQPDNKPGTAVSTTTTTTTASVAAASVAQFVSRRRPPPTRALSTSAAAPMTAHRDVPEGVSKRIGTPSSSGRDLSRERPRPKLVQSSSVTRTTRDQPSSEIAQLAPLLLCRGPSAEWLAETHRYLAMR